MPRTFVVAILTAIAASPLAWITSALGLPKLANLFVARFVLGAATSLSFVGIQRAVSREFGKGAGICYGILQASQFHLLFYSSRFLPNTYALIASNVALAALVSTKPNGAKASARTVILCLTFGAVVFRCDLVLLLGPVSLALLLTRSASVLDVAACGFLGTISSILLTVGVDFYFWGRWIWPELEVFLFNNPVDNRSADWGTAPSHWYFTSALPRALTGALVFAAYGAKRDRRTWPLLAISLSYVSLYSLLPHKETRFIFPALPFFNVVGAVGMSAISKTKGKRRLILAVASVAVIGASWAFLWVSVAASRLNYPGGLAFRDLHQMEVQERERA